MRNLHLKIIILLIGAMTTACLEGFNLTPKEPVMCPGMSITVKRGNDQLLIYAENLKKRKYEIGGHKIEVNLKPRQKRWRGSLGLYLPTGTDEFHLVIDEGVQYFYSEKEAYDWINIVGDRLGYIYSSDGLVVGWELQKPLKSDQKFILHVSLWQIYIQDKMPVSLKGANDKSITISRSSKECGEFKQTTGFYPSGPKTFEGRKYSGKVIDLMNEKEIDPGRVEQAIKLGQKYSKGNYSIYQHDAKGIKFIWVAVDKDGTVVHLDR